MKTDIRIYQRRENANLTAADILPSLSAWETKRQRKLPDDYRYFILTYTGGFPFPNCFDVSTVPWPAFLDENPQALTELYTWPHVMMLVDEQYYRSGYPEGYLIIADAVSPIHLLMGVRDDNWGKVFLWYHSSLDWGSNINHEKDLVFVADSFKDLILSLYDDQSEPAYKYWLRGSTMMRIEQIDWQD
ncbi:MAG: SMI1/KNR4 family protein [Neisseria sp.]|nr:SMI1/KNR4 family protein [Neisseria sp.]